MDDYDKPSSAAASSPSDAAESVTPHVPPVQASDSDSRSSHMLGREAPRRTLQPSAGFLQELRHEAAADSPPPAAPAPDVQATQPEPYTSVAPIATAQTPAYMQPAAAAVPPQPSLPAQPVTTPPPEPARPYVPPPAPGQSLYPEFVATPAEREAASVKSGASLLGIYLIGGLIALGAANNMFMLLRVHGLGAERVFGIMVNLVMLMVGIGIVRLREIARAVYLFLAVLGLVLAAVSTMRLYTYEQTIQKSIPVSIARQQALEDNIRVNSYIDADTKQTLLTSYDKNIAALKKEQGNTLLKTFGVLPLYVLIGYTLAIVPVVFLTRSSVKAKFT